MVIVPKHRAISGYSNQYMWEKKEETMKIRLSVGAGGIVIALLLSAIVTHALGVCVPIDIKPWSCPNSINLNSNGVVPVAILTTPSFDATTVDPTTVTFGPTYGGPGASPVHYAMEDVDMDGDMDMIFQFKVKETGIAPGATEAWINGQTYGGTPIAGVDDIRTVPPH